MAAGKGNDLEKKNKRTMASTSHSRERKRSRKMASSESRLTNESKPAPKDSHKSRSSKKAVKNE
jgi:hypothetical protein